MFPRWMCQRSTTCAGDLSSLSAIAHRAVWRRSAAIRLLYDHFGNDVGKPDLIGNRMAVVRRIVIISGVFAIALVAVPPALATTQTAHSGIVSAKFSFKGGFSKISDETLTIERSGEVFYKEAVSDELCGELPCEPASTVAGHPSVEVLDIEHNDQPDVVLELYSGGANCCFVDQIFSWDPGTMTYSKTAHDFQYAGANIEDLGHNGRLEFLTSDGDFIGNFTDVAVSGAPIRILKFSGRRFHNVTRRYPKLIAKDAAKWLKAFKSMAPHYADSVGLIAPWAADEDLLGNSALVSRYLSQQARARHLNSALADEGAPGGKKFVAELRKFLRKLGYVS
jgi:hypothetical protein